MKLFQKIKLFALLISITIGFSSCLVGLRHDNGYHRSYYKNHPQYTPRNPRVYKMKPEKKYYYYQTKPQKVKKEHDDNRKGSKHEDHNKSKHSRR